jgi:tRNA A-37 threonylcarbamoyl transferase component Bud32
MSYLFGEDTISKICKILTIDDKLDRKKIIKTIKERLFFDSVLQKDYKIINQLGIDGKDGRVYKIKYKNDPKFYALKQFSNKKSIDQIRKEIIFLKEASLVGIAPKILTYNLDKKYIVMEMLEKTLFDFLKEKNGVMDEEIQKKFISVIKKLDKMGIYHGDPSPLNFMFDSGDIKVIDFGMSELVNIKKHKTNEPNINFMLLGFILQMKTLGIDIDNN